MSGALDIADRALAAADPGDGALARVTRERSLLLRFARSRPTQATALDDLTVELAILRDGHVGLATTNRTSTDELAACAGRAAQAAAATARAAGAGPYPGFPPPAPIRPHEGHDPETAALRAEPAGAALAAAFSAAEAKGLEAHGIWTAGEVETAVASTAGTAVRDRVTDALMRIICIAGGTGGRSGFAAGGGSAVAAIEPAALAERAAVKAAVREDPTELPPGEYPVVLERHAVGLLLDLLGEAAFDGLAHTEGRGALAGRLGSRVATPSINLSDSPRFPGTLPRAFDAEGVPKAPLPLIQDGVAHRVVHDTRSAALAGTGTTAHALAPGGGPHGPHPTNLVLIGGGAADEAELCAPVERGVYVTRLWYANLVRPKETLVTAVTRDGTFLIEDGRVTRPLRDLRLTDTLLGILSRVEALSARSVLTRGDELYGRRFAYGVVCPALRACAVRFTGSAG